MMLYRPDYPVVRYGLVEDHDVRATKQALSRLGYYAPPPGTGMDDERDHALFTALQAFQKDYDLPQSDRIMPHDHTVKTIDKALKAQDPTARYVWKTRQDDRVRDAHAAREGQIFTWGMPPEGGHPGEDFNCRCWAVPLKGKTKAPQPEGLKQVVVSPINDAPEKWAWWDYLIHFWTQNGSPVNLPAIGWLGSIIEHAKDEIFPKVEKQVAELARRIQQGHIHYTTENTYEFESASYPIGDAVVRSETRGSVKKQGNLLVIEAKVLYRFEDEFTDILDIREKYYKIGSSTDHPLFEEYKWTEFKGIAYDIDGLWLTRLYGTIRAKN